MGTPAPFNSTRVLDGTAEVVVAYVNNNPVAAVDLAEFIGAVHGAFQKLAAHEPSPAVESLKPAVLITKSVTRDYIICLEEGQQFKSLKRHLRSAHDMTPAQYREKWNLPAEYPMVAPNYARSRSKLAKDMGFGLALRTAKAPSTDS